MWKAINYGCAISDEGIRIKVRRDYISYIDGNFATRIDSAVISKEPYIRMVDFNRVDNWFPPHEHDVVSAEQKKKMIERIVEAMKVLGVEDKLNVHEVEIKENKIFVTITRRNFFEIMESNDQRMAQIRQKIEKI